MSLLHTMMNLVEVTSHSLSLPLDVSLVHVKTSTAWLPAHHLTDIMIRTSLFPHFPNSLPP